MRQASRGNHQWLRVLYGSAEESHLSDSELLDRLRSASNGATEEAFKSLLMRHGPMVLALCQKILGNSHDAEDAFQGTFFVLATRAKEIRRKESVASWLHGVALRVASRIREKEMRRRLGKQELIDVADPDVDHKSPPAEAGLVHEALHQEVQRLPRKYRDAVILCYFQGKTQEAAAVELGCPTSTLGVRLMRARARLKQSLNRRLKSRPESEMLALLLPWADLPPLPDKEAKSWARRVMGTGAGLAATATQATAGIFSLAPRVRRVRQATLALAASFAVLSVGGAIAGVRSWTQPADPSPKEIRRPVVEPAAKPRPEPGELERPDPNRDVRITVEPVPEPSTLVMTGTMALLVGGYAVRRRMSGNQSK